MFVHRRPCILIEVLGTQGSVPREEGAWMWVDEEASFNTIGGGHLELQAITIARNIIQGLKTGTDTKPSLPLLKHFALGPSLGQCCGGTLDLRFSELSDARQQELIKPQPKFHLQLYGAGHVGQAIVNALSWIDCRIDWIDERDSFGQFGNTPINAGNLLPGLKAQVNRLAVDAVESEVNDAGPDTLFLVMTHSHDLDLRIVEAILKRKSVRYLGLIGSKTKRARFEHQLQRKGFLPGDLARITCPIGVDGIKGKEPEVIAVAVAGQLLIAASADNKG